MTKIFHHDDFYGRLHVRNSLPGFTLAHWVPDRPPDEIQTHTHVEAHFVLVTSGRYISSARRGSETAFPLIYNPPGTTHRDRFHQGVGSFFTISVNSDRFNEIVNSRSYRPACFLSDRRSRGLAWALLWESVCRRRSSKLHLESLSLELLGTIHEESSSQERRVDERERPQWLTRTYELLQDDSSRDFTVKELALAVGVHPVHLARAFRRYFRRTPGQLIQMPRLEQAADLLLFSTWPLTEIAIGCNFTDQSHMTTAFRRLYGLPPGQFRNVGSQYRPFPMFHFYKTGGSCRGKIIW